MTTKQEAARMGEKQMPTPGPWYVAADDQGNGTQRVMIRAPHEYGGHEDIAVMLRVGKLAKHANAAFIVSACNQHSQLLERCEALRAGLEDALQQLDDDPAYSDLRADLRALLEQRP